MSSAIEKPTPEDGSHQAVSSQAGSPFSVAGILRGYMGVVVIDCGDFGGYRHMHRPAGGGFAPMGRSSASPSTSVTWWSSCVGPAWTAWMRKSFLAAQGALQLARTARAARIRTGHSPYPSLAEAASVSDRFRMPSCGDAGGPMEQFLQSQAQGDDAVWSGLGLRETSCSGTSAL